MALEITALEASLHNNLEAELESDRQKEDVDGKHASHKKHEPKSFFGKMWDGLKQGAKQSVTKENLAWAATVAVASLAAAGVAYGIVGITPDSAFTAISETIGKVGIDMGAGQAAIDNAQTLTKMIGLSTFLPITFGFARAFRDGYGENDRQAQKHQHKEHEKGRGKVREHAQGHANQQTQTRDQERVNGTVAPIPVLATAARQEPAAPHAHTNASERPAYLQNILAQGPNSQNRSHVAALEAEPAIAGSRGV